MIPTPSSIHPRVVVEPESTGGVHPLEGQGREGDLPSLSLALEEVSVFDDGIAQEDLAERCVAAHGDERSSLDSRLLHVDAEVAQPSVLRDVDVRAGDQDAPLGLVGRGVPDLLAIEDPVPTVLDRSGGRRSQIRARSGL